MSYATQQDLVDRFGEQELIQLTDRNNNFVIDATVVARALADADAEIDGYLAGRYTLPLASVPVVLVRLAADMARYFLYDDRATEQVKARYDSAVRFLRSVASGDVSLGLSSANQPAPQSGGVQVAAGDRVFSAGSLSDY
ncbi:MAG: DUF1320 domain-containing protein [Pseudomonadota bacterium]